MNNDVNQLEHQAWTVRAGRNHGLDVRPITEHGIFEPLSSGDVVVQNGSLQVIIKCETRSSLNVHTIHAAEQEAAPQNLPLALFWRRDAEEEDLVIMDSDLFWELVTKGGNG